MSKAAEKPVTEYRYLTRIKIQLIVIALGMAGVVPVAVADGGKYGIAAAALAIALGFAFMIWQDSASRILVYADRLVHEKGAGPFRQTLTVNWREGLCLKDDTGVFTLGRSYRLSDKGDASAQIRINSVMEDYKEILGTIIKRCPGLEMNGRTKTSLTRMGVDVSRNGR